MLYLGQAKNKLVLHLVVLDSLRVVKFYHAA